MTARPVCHRRAGEGALSASADDQPYLGTLAFYTALGFRVLEEMPSLWGPTNPAVMLVKRL